MKIAFITIGQSPRDDVLGEILPKLKLQNVTIFEKGALDMIDEVHLKPFLPESEEDTLITRLRSGKSVKVSRKKILPLLKKLIQECEKIADIIILLCTDDFPELRGKKLIKPFELMIKEIMKRKIEKLGIIVPLPEQIPKAIDKWSKVAKITGAISLSPYESTQTLSPQKVKTLENSQAIVMDCIGYSFAHKRIITETLNIPVILPREILINEIKRIQEIS